MKKQKLEKRLALADEIVRQVRQWARYCEENKMRVFGDLPIWHAIEAYEAAKRK